MQTNNTPPTETRANNLASRGWMMRLVQHWSWLLWTAALIGLLVLFAWFTLTWTGGVTDGVTGWLQNIEDPTERGCAYIAIAIAAHAVVMVFKTMSPSTAERSLNHE